MKQTNSKFQYLDALVDQFATTGNARMEDVAAGGETWALFRDWCHVAGVAPSVEAISEWYAVSGRPLCASEHKRLSETAEALSDG